MGQNQTFKEWDPFYSLYLLWRYYSGQLLHVSAKEWRQFGEDVETAFPSLKKEIARIKEMGEEEAKRFPFEFNRLFIGPGKLLASPYASSYLNPEGLLMQGETMSVRSFYESADLQAADEGSEPDDHLALELEFLLYLLVHEEKEDDTGIYTAFIETHLMHWCFRHCELIHESTTHPISLFFAGLLEHFLGEEQKRLKIKETRRKSTIYGEIARDRGNVCTVKEEGCVGFEVTCREGRCEGDCGKTNIAAERQDMKGGRAYV